MNIKMFLFGLLYFSSILFCILMIGAILYFTVLNPIHTLEQNQSYLDSYIPYVFILLLGAWLYLLLKPLYIILNDKTK
jgi:hypothetical protein